MSGAKAVTSARRVSAVAAVGSDGLRLVVWGLGSDDQDALEDAAPYTTEDAYRMPRLRCVAVTEEQRAQIVAGEIDCATLGIDSRERCTSAVQS